MPEVIGFNTSGRVKIEPIKVKQLKEDFERGFGERKFGVLLELFLNSSMHVKSSDLLRTHFL